IQVHAEFLAKTDKVKTKNAPKSSKNKCDLTQFEQVEFEKLQSQFKDKLTSTESYKNELNDINQTLKEGLELISNSINVCNSYLSELVKQQSRCIEQKNEVMMNHRVLTDQNKHKETDQRIIQNTSVLDKSSHYQPMLNQSVLFDDFISANEEYSGPIDRDVISSFNANINRSYATPIHQLVLEKHHKSKSDFEFSLNVSVRTSWVATSWQRKSVDP
ncbi:hypothetical protein BpHYR1_040371, partial [Brachionus plicatilis]